MYLECGNVETRKSVYIRKSLFKEAGPRGIMTRVFIPDTLLFFRAVAPARSSYSVRHIYPFSRNFHRMTKCVSRIMNSKARASYIS